MNVIGRAAESRFCGEGIRLGYVTLVADCHVQQNRVWKRRDGQLQLHAHDAVDKPLLLVGADALIKQR